MPAFSVDQEQEDSQETRVSGSTPFPDIKSGPANEIWATFFRQHRPADRDFRRVILKLHGQSEHEHVIHAIQAALLNGQSQPWMYEVLALSMEIAGRPREDVQRVLLSLTDFGDANFESMMYSAAYLLRFNREKTALKLYRQASRHSPERAEPYLLGLKLARNHPEDDAVLWAATGILKYGWTKDHEQFHQQAEDAILEESRRLRKSGDADGLATLQAAVEEAKQRDLRVTLSWNGAADLDLTVDEPGGTEAPASPGGGIHLFDGFGPLAKNCREEYVCPEGVSGTYRLRIKLAWGDVVGRRAQLTIIKHAGTPLQEIIRRSVTIGAEPTVVPVTLEGGRRKQPRRVAKSHIDPVSAIQRARQANRRGAIQLTEHARSALESFQDSRRQSAPVTGVGAIGVQSVISNVNDGVTITAQPIVSADRRYVRIGVNAQFNTLTDVFTFSFLNVGNVGTQGTAVVGPPVP